MDFGVIRLGKGGGDVRANHAATLATSRWSGGGNEWKVIPHWGLDIMVGITPCVWSHHRMASSAQFGDRWIEHSNNREAKEDASGKIHWTESARGGDRPHGICIRT
jgi:hypothetical protein